MPKGYHHVTQDTRSQIYALKSIGTSLRKIATVVERHVSTISPEIQRNTCGRGYRYKQANAKAVDRRANASRTPKKLTSELITIIETHLREEWSPDQIAGHLNQSQRRIVFQSITLDGDNMEHVNYHRQRVTQVTDTYGPTSHDYNPERFLALRAALNQFVAAVEAGAYHEFEVALSQAVDSALESYDLNHGNHQCTFL
jgi:IS30 family transposase